MPSLGRHLTGSATTAALLLTGSAGATAVTSLMWGPEFTATLDNYARVRLDLYWPDVRTATITRYDADGTNSTVRNAEPLTVLTQAVVYDHEAPLDKACTYVVTSSEAPETSYAADPVYVSSSGRSWLKHPLKPYLNRAVHLHAMPPRSLPARRGVARPIDRADPIVVYQPRATDSGSVVIQTDGTWAENTALRALLADGAPLLLQQIGVLGEGNLYISVDTVTLALLEDRTGFQLRRNITLPFDVVGRPPGTASGPVGGQYSDAAARFLTYDHLAAAATPASYYELAGLAGI